MSAVIERPPRRVARALVTPPMMGVCRNPLIGMQPSDMHAVPTGVALRDFVIEHHGALVCSLNGEWLLREHWDTLTKPGDVIHWYDMPRDRTTLRTVLSIVVVILMWWNPLGWGAAGVAAFGVGANLAINLAIPIRPPDAGVAPGSVNSVSLGGNVARLDAPIWKVCGRVKATPSYAAMPYVRYLPSDPAEPMLDCDQYLYVLYALGEGEYDVEKAFLGKTSLTHFEDVLRATYLPPGTYPTEVKANIITSDEVSSLAMPGLDENDVGHYTAAIAASRPGDLVTTIEIDIYAPQGLGGAMGETREAKWQVEIRQINDYGAPASEWQVIADERSGELNTNTPQRWTFYYELSAPIRCEVRLLRTDHEASDAAFRDAIEWSGLKAHLAKPAPLNAETAHYELIVRASQQLSQASQRDFSLILRGHCRTLNADLEWQPAEFTRNAAWWMLDLLTNPTWGLGLPDERIDLQGFYDLSQTCEARQDRFDYVFAEARDAWSALQLISTSCRSRIFRRGIVYTVARDELVELPVTAFTARNTSPKSMKMHSSLPTREQPDGVVVQYQSNVTWDTAIIECPCPGYTVTDSDSPDYDPDLPMMSSPIWMSLDGVTGATHAKREGVYQAASIAYRRETVACQIEYEGMVVAFMDAVRWQPQLRGYGQTGDVAFWDPDTLVMGLTEPPDWSQGSLLLTLRRDDGTVTEPIPVTPGPTANDVVLPAAPDFELVLEDGTRERPIFLLGTAAGDELVKVTALKDGGKSDGGAQLFDIEGMVDDDRVHEADNALLPGPGDIQDPIDNGDDEDSGSSTATLVRLLRHEIIGGTAGLPDNAHRGGAARFSLLPDGTNEWATGFDGADLESYTVTGVYPREWLNPTPVEPTVAALYEVYAEDYGDVFTNSAGNPGVLVTGTFNAWLPLSIARTWSIAAGPPLLDSGFGGSSLGAALRLRIRRINSTTVLATQIVTLIVQLTPSDGGDDDGDGGGE